MKEWIKRIIESLLILIIINCLIFSGFSQSADNRNNNFALRVNAGLTYFLGDLDKGPIKYGAGLGIERSFSPKFSIGGNVVMANLSGYHNGMNLFFESKINEITLNARAYLLEILTKSNSRKKISPYLSFGLGIINYKTDLRTYDLKQPLITPVNKVTATVPIGAGINYSVNDKIDLNFDFGLRIAGNDKLDAKVSMIPNDMYAFVSAGIIYRFGNPGPVKTPQTRNRTIPKVSENNIISEAERKYNEMLEEKQSIPIETADVTVTSDLEPRRINAGEIFEVRLIIDKGDYKGSLKIEQTYHPGFEPIESSPGNNSFSFYEPKLVIQWDVLPEKDQIVYSYKVKVDNNISGSYIINGLVSYPQAGGDRILSLENFIFVENEIESEMDREIQNLINKNIIPEESITTTTENLNDFSEIEDILSAFENPRTDTIRQQEVKTPVKKITSTNFIEGIEYRIQVGAFRKKDNQGFLIRKFNITDPVQEELHNGWYKYTVGSFTDLHAAKRFRDDFIQQTRHLSSYIVAYKNGVRLSTLPKIR